jgi:heptosyltransferase-3
LITAPRNIIISRTDSIGDVMLTLPLAKILKDHFPDVKIAFLGKSYTRPVIEACEYIDEFIDLDDFLQKDITIAGQHPECIIHVFPLATIAKRAKALAIPLRIGTTNRLYHWTTCNKLVSLSRKNSDLHEAQLNTKLLAPLGITRTWSTHELGSYFGLTRLKELPERFTSLLDPSKYNLILHPKSQGSAREWGLNNFISLIRSLGKDKFNILISGTEKERPSLQPIFDQVKDQVTDITGLMNLNEFIAFIAQCDGLVANSTGPLHIAAALGKDAFGIYPPMRPIHPGRWAPLGPKVKVFVLDKDCSDCRKDPASCSCIMQVSPASIHAALEQARNNTSHIG